MLPTIEDSRETLPTLSAGLSIFNAGAVAVFAYPLCANLSIHHLLVFMAIGAFIGLVIGLHFKFRSACGSTSAIFRLFYFLIAMEVIFGGGGAGLALKIAGHPNLCWIAFYTNSLIILLSLLAGAVREARKFELWGDVGGTDKSDRWKLELEKYIDYTKHQVHPAVIDASPSSKKKSSLKSSFWIVAIGGANIPLLFDIYGGGRNNVMFFAAPLMTAVFVYINIKSFGPGGLRLWLLRKLEKAAGCRFINADYEQIQALRRTFFLSRWLMKDYAAPQPVTSVQKMTKQPKRRRK